MDQNNVELSNIIPFKEDGCWFLKLIYKYDGDDGKHAVVIPRAAIPFTQCSLPCINFRRISKLPYIDCANSMSLYKSDFDLAIEQGVKDFAYYFDIITEYATKEMTIDEIERELGYKIKIANKKSM